MGSGALEYVGLITFLLLLAMRPLASFFIIFHDCKMIIVPLSCGCLELYIELTYVEYLEKCLAQSLDSMYVSYSQKFILFLVCCFIRF